MTPSNTHRLMLVAIVSMLAASFSTVEAQKAWKVFGKANGTTGDDVISMDISGSTLWVATTYIDPGNPEADLEGGVSIMDPETNTFTTYTPNEGLPAVKVWATLIDGNKVWFGTPNGLCVLDTGKLATLEPYDLNKAFTTYTTKDGLVYDDVKCLAKNGSLLWFGTVSGLGSLDTSSMLWSSWPQKDGFPTKNIESIAIDGKYIWFGTTDGPVRYDTDSDRFESFRTPGETIGANVIPSLAVDDEYVWIGTREGLYALDKASSQWTYYGEDKLPDVWVSTIAIHDGEVWIGTRKGIAVLDKAKGKIKTIDDTKGLSHNDIRAIEFAGDIVWIGTGRGINRYDPGAKAAQLRQIILVVVLIVAAGSGAAFVKIKYLKPSPEELEERRKAAEVKAKRKERRRTGEAPWQVCKGVPSKDLCGRCKYNSVRAGKLHCSKYDKDLE